MGKKILLADDSITIQKVIELTFSDEDFDVVTVGNGRLALERLAEVRPDIVLCDIIMPERDGYEVCEQIKSSPMWSHVPVLLLTGAFEPFDQARATRAGCDGSLAKPFEPETLIAKVKDLLARAPRPVQAPPPAVVPNRPVAPPAVAPSVVPFARPAPIAPPASFIPEEPFAALDDASFPPETPREAAVQQAPLAPMSQAEAASLSVPPASGAAVDDGTSTVLFRATQLPWDVAAPSQPPAPPIEQEPGEPVFVPDAGEPVIEPEPAAFEAVLEEDLDFGTPDYVGEAARDAQAGAAVDASVAEDVVPEPPAEEPIFPPEITEAHEQRQVPGGTTGAFAALVREELVVRDEGPVTRTAAFAQLASTVAAASETPAVAAEAAPEPREAAAEPHRELLPPSIASGAIPRLDASVEPSAPAVGAPDAPVGGAADALPEPEPEGLIEEFPEPEPDTLAPVPPTFLLRRPEPRAEEVAASAPVAESASEPAPAVSAMAAPAEAAPVAEEAPAVSLVPPQPIEEPASELPPVEPVAAAAFREAEAAASEPEPVVSPAEVAAPPADFPEEETFADVVEPPTERADETTAAHVAAQQAVPVEMVERIAQRVIAQISDKVIREIAWEVIPDLAETLIKQEIERLKQELAKL